MLLTPTDIFHDPILSGPTKYMEKAKLASVPHKHYPKLTIFTFGVDTQIVCSGAYLKGALGNFKFTLTKKTLFRSPLQRVCRSGQH